jgi:hypothetical protein
MLLIDDLLLAPLQGVLWVARKLDEAARQEREQEEDRLKARLRELYLRLDAGQLEAAEFEAQEAELLTIQVRLVVCSVDKAAEMGMDFWRSEPHLSPLARREPPPALPEPEALTRRVAELEAALARLEGAGPRG